MLICCSLKRVAADLLLVTVLHHLLRIMPLEANRLVIKQKIRRNYFEDLERRNYFVLILIIFDTRTRMYILVYKERKEKKIVWLFK